MWLRIAVALVAGLAAGYAAVRVRGERRWAEETRALRAGLEAARAPRPAAAAGGEMGSLPTPVRRYLEIAIPDGAPGIAAADIRHSGTFNMGTDADRWRPFTSTQRVVTRRPGFDWDGRIAMLPGLPVRVHDAYVAGEGRLHAAVLGLISVADLRGTPEMAEGELMRFLAEAVWYPTALRPGGGVRWDAIDDRSARATLEDGGIAVSLVFGFDDAGLVAGVRADARGRSVGDAVVPTPWAGRFWNYATVDGMRVPLDGEVAWVLPDGPRAYWRGHIESLRYERAP